MIHVEDVFDFLLGHLELLGEEALGEAGASVAREFARNLERRKANSLQ